jgi:putative tricarboxylic transport membrane protein
MVGLSVISSVAAGSLLRGLIGGLIGLLLALPGMDPLSGDTRLTLGLPLLQDGIHLVPFVLGFFAVAEALVQLQNFGAGAFTGAPILSSRRPTRAELLRLMPTIGRSSVIGAAVAAVPGHGATIAAMLCYELERRFSRNGRRFGTGVAEGIAAPEAAAAGSVGGALIPLVTLGIPGSASTSVILATLTLHGIPIGQSLLSTQPEVAYALMLGLAIALVVILVVGYFGVKFWVRVASMPPNIVLMSILVLSVVGAFTVRSDLNDVWTMLICGLIGFVLRKMRIPPAPVVMAFILEPIIEMSFRRALMTSGGDFNVFISSPLAVMLFVLAFVSFVLPVVFDHRRRGSKSADAGDAESSGNATEGKSAEVTVPR